MSLSIPSDNLRKINNLDEIPYKDIKHHKVYNNYLNQMNYLLSLSGDEIDNQIEEDINNYNKYIDLIISKNNRISSNVRNEYNNLLTKLTADKRVKYLNNKYDDVIDPSILFNEEENNFSNDDNLNNSDDSSNLKEISTIEDLLSFSEGYKPDTTFFDETILNNKTDNYKETTIDQIRYDFNKIDEAIKDYNYMIEVLNNGEEIDSNEMNTIIENIKEASKLYRYYYFDKIELNQLYPIAFFYHPSYSQDFRNMLYLDFDQKLLAFKDEVKNINKMYLKIRYFEKNYDTKPKARETSMQVTNSNLLPEYVLQGFSKETIIKTNPDVTKKYSGGEDLDTEVPLASLYLSFEFFNGYDRAKEKQFGEKLDSTRTNREGQLFQYKINTPVFKEYFKKDAYLIIKYLRRYQIFEEFNPSRDEYRYNCLMYSLYTWFCENKSNSKSAISQSKEYAENICRQLGMFNISRMVTSNDINKINEYFEKIANKIGVRYKIAKYIWNDKRNELRYNGDNKDKSKKTIIPICLLETSKINGLRDNHYILKEQVDFKILNKYDPKLNIDDKDNKRILELIAGLKDDDNKRNWENLSSHSLIKYLLENKNHKFFTEFNSLELKEVLDEKDEIKNKMKNKKLIDCIKEMTDYERDGFTKEVSTLNSKTSKPKDISFDNVVSDDPNWNNEYDYLCVYDFEASTQEESCHKSYMVCYCLMEYPEHIYNDKEMNDFIKNFDKNHKIKTIKGEDCAKKFLDILPDKCLCYAHNVKYDLSFFNEKDIDISIKSCEKDNKIYSRSIKYDNKHFTFKDSYKLIPSKLKLFPSMFKLGNIVKEVFPYNFYSLKNLKKYGDKDIKIDTPEYNDIRKELIKSFGTNYKTKYIKFKQIIRNKFNGIFNMWKYSEFYCKRDVEILTKGLICMRTYTYRLTSLDCFNYLTIPSIIHRVMLSRVYTNTEAGEKAYMYSGYLNQYIQSALYGGVCTSWRNSKLWVDKIISDYDAKSLYPSAIKRLYLVTGKCRPFKDEMVKEINDSMYDENGNYDSDKCWLLDNTNKEKENDKNKINAYIVTVKITDTKRKRNSPRIIVKNVVENGKLKYPHLPEGSIMVNIDKDFDVNKDEYKRKKQYYIKEAEVTIDNIMLEDYIKYHGIKFELIGGLYWRNSEYTTLYDCFENLNKLESRLNTVYMLSKDELATVFENYRNQLKDKKLQDEFNEMSLEDKKKKCDGLIKKIIKRKTKEIYKEEDIYELRLANYSFKHPEIFNKYCDLKAEYDKVKEQLYLLEDEGVYTMYHRRLREDYKKQMNDIKEQIYKLDTDDSGYKSSKHYEIQKVIQKYYDDRADYQKQGNPIEKVIKLLLNSVYGKTIQNYTDKKISYVKIYDKSFTKFNSAKDKEFKLKLIDKWRNKVAEQYKCNEISEDEFKYQMKDLENLKVRDDGIEYEYSPYRKFLDNNKNKIVSEEVVNDNMMRIETIEQIENHYTLNLLGVQILSMSKRIMNEVICTAEDIGIRVYYQDTDSIHIDDDKIELLEKEFEKRFGRKLRGDQLGQFHPDFDKCNIKNNNCVRYVCNTKEDYDDINKFIDEYNDVMKQVHSDNKDVFNKLKINVLNKIEKENINTTKYYIYFDTSEAKKFEKTFKSRCGIDLFDKYNITKENNQKALVKSGRSLSKLLIICGKKMYLDILFDPDIKSEDYSNIDNFRKNHHIRLKGIPKKLVYITARDLGLNKNNKDGIKELYLKLLRGESILFKISKYAPSFKFTNQQTVINAKLERELKCDGGYYKIDKFTKDNPNNDPKDDPEYIECEDKTDNKNIKSFKILELRKKCRLVKHRRRVLRKLLLTKMNCKDKNEFLMKNKFKCCLKKIKRIQTHLH